jgi:hypothetical protein
LLEELQAFAAQLGTAAGQSSDVSTWSCEVRDESSPNGIRNEHEDNWNAAGRVLGGESLRRGGGHDDVDIHTDKLGGKPRVSLELPVREPILDGNALTLYVPELAQALPEGVDLSRASGRAIEQVPDPGNLAGRLWVGNYRRSQKEPKTRQETPATIHG